MIHQPSNLAAARAAWRLLNGIPESAQPSWRWTRAVAGERPRLYVYGMIGGWDLDAAEFVRTVHDLDTTDLDLHVNSPGGFVWDAVSMFEALRSHPATVHTHVDGVAASAASFVALAGDLVDTAAGSRWMVHDAQTIGIGSPAELREAADLADAVSDDIAGIYADRAGGTAAGWRAAMTATTWYSASEAVDVGLAQAVAGAKTESSGATNRSRLIKARAAVALGGVK